MVLLNIFIINLLVVFVVDLSGFIPELESVLSKSLRFKVRIPKPFSCSLCLTWWTALLYLVLSYNLTLPYVLAAAAVSLFSKNTGGFIRWIQEALVKLEDSLYKLIR